MSITGFAPFDSSAQVRIEIPEEERRLALLNGYDFRVALSKELIDVIDAMWLLASSPITKILRWTTNIPEEPHIQTGGSEPL